jgi:SAM-dependent methyltransferase
MQASDHRQRFIEHTLAQRRDEDGRALLAAEWRYIGPLLGAPAGAGGAPAEGGSDVLDLACGSGHQTLAWAERGFRVTGLDFDHDLLLAGRARFARAPARAPAAWAQADAVRLPFRDGSFDVVFNNSLLEHVPAWRAVLAETARVLRPGGVFVMYTTNRACPVPAGGERLPVLPGSRTGPAARVLAWIMAHRRELVTFTDFSGRELVHVRLDAAGFRAVGLEPYDRLSTFSLAPVPAGSGGSGLGDPGRAARGPTTLGAISMALYGVRRGQRRRPPPSHAGRPDPRRLAAAGQLSPSRRRRHPVRYFCDHLRLTRAAGDGSSASPKPPLRPPTIREVHVRSRVLRRFSCSQPRPSRRGDPVGASRRRVPTRPA